MQFNPCALTASTLALLKTAADTARRTESALYLVGGIVRDVLRGAPQSVTDVDLIIDGNIAKFSAELSEQLGGVLHGPSPFLTYRIDYTLGGKPRTLDIITPRREIYTSPAALPKVFPSTIIQDLARRDFTVNAMAVRIDNGSHEIIDPFDGQGDLVKRRLHILHQASFTDDPTRIFRAGRFAVRCGLNLDPDDTVLLHNSLKYLPLLSGTRIRHELELVAKEKNPVDILSLLTSWHVDQAAGLSSAAEHCSLLFKTLSDYPALCTDQGLRFRLLLTGLCNELSPQNTVRFTQRIGLAGKDAKSIECCRRSAEIASRLHTISARTDLLRHTDADADSILHALPLELLITLIADADTSVAKLVDRHIRIWRNLRPILTGKDICRCGIAQGADIGKLLSLIRFNHIRGTISSKKEAIDLIRRQSAALH